MDGQETEDRRRDEEHVGRVEAGQRGATDVLPGDDERREEATDDGRPRGLLRRDDDGPERVLVPPQQLSGERHRERGEEEERAAHPVRLARELVRAEQEDLRHVHEDEDHHRAGAEVVDAAHDAAERRLAADELERVVRAVRRRHVRHGQTDAGRHLHDEHRERRASEDVPPADAALERGGHRMRQHRADGVLELEAQSDPPADRPDEPAHGEPPPGVGRRWVFTVSFLLGP